MMSSNVRLSTSGLTRVLRDCNPRSEVVVMVGSIALTLPIKSVSVMENGAHEEIIALHLDADETLKILDAGVEMVKHGENNE